MLVPQQVQAVKDAAEDEDDDNETCATLTKKVANLEQDKIAQAIKITKLKQRVKRGCILTRGKIAELDADEDVTLVDAEEDINADVQGRLAEYQVKVYHLDLQHAEKVLSMQDTDEAEHVEVEEVIEAVTTAKLMTEDDVMEQVKTREKQDNTVMRYQALKIKPVTEAQARKNMMIYLKNMAGFKMDFFKGMIYNDIRHIFEKHYNSIKAFLEKKKEEIEEEGNKRKRRNLKQDIAKKQRIDEEVEDLKAHLQFVADDDDLYTEATPLALKLLIVDYQIHHKHNKPYYKIIRAYEIHQLFLSFITLLKNFDREDFKML
nr:hypothetical protein [Tanacetum cinerariifolium]